MRSATRKPGRSAERAGRAGTKQPWTQLSKGVKRLSRCATRTIGQTWSCGLIPPYPSLSERTQDLFGAHAALPAISGGVEVGAHTSETCASQESTPQAVSRIDDLTEEWRSRLQAGDLVMHRTRFIDRPRAACHKELCLHARVYMCLCSFFVFLFFLFVFLRVCVRDFARAGVCRC